MTMRTVLILLAACALWSTGCEQKTDAKTGPEPSSHASVETTTQSTALPMPPHKTDAPSAQTPSPPDTEPPSKLNGRAIADPKGYRNPEEAGVGTLPDGIGIAVGSRVPDFEAKNVAGERVTRDTLLAQGAVLMVFYRGGW